MIANRLRRAFAGTAALLLCICMATGAAAQVKKSTRIIKSPKKDSYDIGNTDFKLENGYRGDKRWMVFVSQEGASSYTRPGGEAKLKALPFMEACYVIRKRGEYLELVRYSPNVKFRKWSRKVANWEDLDYVGWVHQSKVLPWQVALRDENSKFFVKYITALRGRDVYLTPDKYFIGDSLRVLGQPATLGTTRRRLPASTILFAYQLSEDRRYYLVGTEPQCVPDSAQKVILGWMPVESVQPWGEKTYVTTGSPSGGLIAVTGSGGSGSLQMNLPDASLNLFPAPAQTLFPVYSTRTGSSGERIIRTTLLTNTLDYSRNRVYNVLGEPISWSRFLQVRRDFSKLNVVLLLDGSTANASFTAPVMTVLQQLQLSIDSIDQFDQIRYAAAIYQGEGRNCLTANTLPLTQDYRRLSSFFESGLSAITNCTEYGGHSVFEGLGDATQLLNGHEDESNVIIVIGAREDDTRSYEWTSIINSLTAKHARLLVYQTHSDASASYNNFVIDAKKLITQSADNIIALRKELVVKNSPASEAYDFRISTGEQSVFMLDYPARSRWQGAVVFPNKFESMPLLTLNQTLDTLLTQIRLDNDRTVAALDGVFSSYAGNMGTQIDARMSPLLASADSALPDRFFRYFRKRFDVFAFPAILSADTSRLEKGLLLTREELDGLIFRMSNVMEPFNNPDYSRQRAARRVRRYARQSIRETGMQKPKRYRAMSLGDVSGLYTGMTFDDPVIQQTRLVRYGSEREMSDARYRQMLNDMDRYYLTLKSGDNSMGLRMLHSGDRVYYWIPVRL